MLNIRVLLFPLFSLFCLFFFSSCSTRRNILVNFDRTLYQESIQVDFIGISNNSKKVLEKCTFFQYWKIDGLKKKHYDFEKEINFLPFDDAYEKTISSKSKIWEKWSNEDYRYIFIAIDLPIKQSQNIIWKKIIGIQSYSWYNFWSDRNLYVNVDKQGLTLNNE